MEIPTPEMNIRPLANQEAETRTRSADGISNESDPTVFADNCEAAKTKKRKAPSPNAQGFKRAPTGGTCALCLRRVRTGQSIRRMPENWKPESTLRHSHRRCVMRWVHELEEAIGKPIDLTVPRGYNDPPPWSKAAREMAAKRAGGAK